MCMGSSREIEIFGQCSLDGEGTWIQDCSCLVFEVFYQRDSGLGRGRHLKTEKEARGKVGGRVSIGASGLF